MNITENIFVVVSIITKIIAATLLAWIILSWAEIAFHMPFPDEPPTYSKWNIFTMI